MKSVARRRELSDLIRSLDRREAQLLEQAKADQNLLRRRRMTRSQSSQKMTSTLNLTEKKPLKAFKRVIEVPIYY